MPPNSSSDGGRTDNSLKPTVRHVEVPDEASVDGVPLYDLRGLQCPLPALKTGKRMRNLSKGDRLWVETTDPLAVIDIPAYANENGHTLVESHAVEGGHRFLLECRGEQGS